MAAWVPVSGLLPPTWTPPACHPPLPGSDQNPLCASPGHLADVPLGVCLPTWWVGSQLPCTNIPLLYKRPPPSQLGEVDEDDAIMTLGDAGHEVGFIPHNTTQHNSFRLNSTAVAPPTHSLAPSPGHCNDPLRPHLSVFHTHTHTHRHTHTNPYASACGIVQVQDDVFRGSCIQPRPRYSDTTPRVSGP